MEQDANQGKGPTYSKEQAIYMLEFIGRVRRVFIGSVFAVVALVFLLVFQPMQAELRKSLTDGFAQMSRTNHYVIENTVERCIEGAESLSSRTMIKNAIREYKSGKMSLEELKTYTQPKYEDGARAIDQVCLAHRVVDDETVALYQVGELCPDISCADIGAGQGSEFMPRIITKGERAYAAMNAPIIIENATVGHDFVVYDMTEQIKALSTDSMEVFLMDDSAYQELLDASAKTESDGETAIIMKDGLVYWSAPIVDVHLVSVQDRSTLYKPIRQLAKSIIIGGAVVLAAFTAVVYFYIFLHVKGELRSLESSRNAFKEMAYMDHLTGAYSRQFLDVWNRSLRSHQSSYAIVVIDVDDFKEINDIYGHATGDKVLQQIASTVSASIRQGDLLARYGGDEFVLVLADIGAENAQSLLARVGDQLILPLAGQDPIHIGISYGMSLLAGNDDLGDKLKQADGEMYEAKRAKKSK